MRHPLLLALALVLVCLPASVDAKPQSRRIYRAVGLGLADWRCAGTAVHLGDSFPPPFIEFRDVYAMDEHLRLSFLVDATLVNPRTVGNAYSWYVHGSGPDITTKWVLLYPLLPLLPLIGAHVTVGPTFGIATRRRPPAAWLDAGINLSLFPRPSDHSWVFGFGVSAGAGIDITRRLGLSVRAHYTPRVVNEFTYSPAGDVTTLMAAFDLLIP